MGSFANAQDKIIETHYEKSNYSHNLFVSVRLGRIGHARDRQLNDYQFGLESMGFYPSGQTR